MNDNENNSVDYNRRDFLKSGSLATAMAMLGGVQLVAQTTNAPAGEEKKAGPKVKVAVIGLGPWGREIVNMLARLDQAELAAICDNYPASVRRTTSSAPGAATTEDYKTILANADIKAVIVATPTHQHKEIVLDALKAGKHVYCEAPLATTVEDAKAIAQAAQAAKRVVFQAGLQLRSDKERLFLLPFIRAGSLGKTVMARGQWHKKQSWRSTSPNPDREKAINWRLSKETSTGLMGEFGTHHVDQVGWYLNTKPTAVTGFGAINFWTDGRDVPDTVQAVFEYPGGVQFTFDSTLANSFEGEYDVLYGSDAAVMLRDNKGWMFKEVDSPLFGWEVYAKKEVFFKETGIALLADASKPKPAGEEAAEVPFTNTPLYYALQNFLRNCGDVTAAIEDFISSFGADDQEALNEHVAKLGRQPAAGYLDGYIATVIGIKAHEAIMAGKRVELKPDLYELT